MDTWETDIKVSTRRSWGRMWALVLLVAVPRLTCAEPHHPAPASPEVPFTLRVGYQPYFAEAWSGALIRALRLHAGRLPPGVAVEFEVGTKGADVLVSALRRGDVDLAYLGLAPTLTVTQDTAQGDFRILAVSSVSRRLCNIIVAHAGATPSSPEAAARWLAGKTVGVPHGSCADLFLADVLEWSHVQPARVLDQSIDVLSTSLRAHMVDAVAVWEPIATDLVRTTGAVRLIDGDAINESSAAFIVIRASLLRDHADVVKGWLAAERAAQLLLAKSESATVALEALERQAVGYSRQTLREAWSGPATSAPAPPARFPFVVTADVSALLADAARRMASRGLLASGQLRPETVSDASARVVLATSETRAQPAKIP
jgi:NitT/TauT family transport system substrate-binding protein